ncbi:MAG: FecR domain-containing protein [Bacteroidetes bacterium]|nr:FecR domain-containing protein [Bacteroidota bacterium]
MSQDRIAYLLQQYHADNTTPAERAELVDLLGHAGNDESVAEALQKAMEAHVPASSYMDRDYSALLQKVVAVDRPFAMPARKNSIYQLRPWKWVAAAAIMLAVAGAGYSWYAQRHEQHPAIAPPVIAKTKDIAPGRQGAVLILGDGTRMVLDSMKDGVVATQGGKTVVLQGGVVSYHAVEGIPQTETLPATNTISTPRGRQYQLQLPDGSQVWLNAESAISYPVAFTGVQRKVRISGEAYFEVTKNEKPFIVDVDGRASVQVLGTHFNINSYHNEEEIKTTLLEGSVRMSAADAQIQPIIMSAGQQAVVTKDHQIKKVEHPDVELAMAWKNGLFMLQDANLQELMRQLARWYDIDIRYEGPVPAVQFGGKMDKGVRLSTVTKWFADLDIPCHLENRILIVGK